MSDQGTGQPLALPSGATTDPVANGRHKGQMPRWATADATHASFATLPVAGHSDIYVPPATGSVAGAQSAADKAKLDAQAAITTINAPLVLAAGALGVNLANPLKLTGSNLDLGWVAPFKLTAGNLDLDILGAPLVVITGKLAVQQATASQVGYMSTAYAALVDQLATATAWVGMTGGYGTNWSDSGGGQAVGAYKKDALGWICLKGLIKKSIAAAMPETLFTLPVGSRPATDRMYTVPVSGGVGEIRIKSTGVIELNNATAGSSPATYTSFGDIRFDPSV